MLFRSVHGQPGELLEGVEHLSVTADQMVEIAADDLDRSTVAIDVHVDVTVQIGDVEETLEEVSGDVALVLELRGVSHDVPPFGLFVGFFFGPCAVMSGFFLATGFC